MPSVTYLPLKQQEELIPLHSKRTCVLRVLIFCSVFLNVFLCAQWLSRGKPGIPLTSTARKLYSPAEDAVEYVILKFHSAFGTDIPIYDQEPSEEVDAAWQDLYEYAYNKIPREQAALIPNRTYPVLGQEDHYMIALDVFHQLHCLNEMRKAMYPEYYPLTPEGIHTPHMRHCISSLRQSLMCSADVTPIVWQWSERSKAAKERNDVVHTCRNFDKIKEWAHQHLLDHQQDMSVYIEDDLHVPSWE
ncbi:hypothetical protein L218DRAFT_4111 [Marasmius fiardii PR-910]|nr:hypothetical protein L218DRAFT_4111 [Marasmius fiardii PR-910]